MRWTILGLVLVGIVAAGAATMLAIAIQARNGNPVNDPANQIIDIVVAARKLSANTIVDADAVQKSSVKRSEAPPDVLTNPIQVINHMLLTDVLPGEPLTAKKFPAADSDLALAQSLPPGMRAMSIALNSETGIEDLLYPGCIVDVVATFRLPAMNGQGYGQVLSATVLEQIPVLAVGKRSIMAEKPADGSPAPSGSAEAKRARMITLRVDADQAEMLQLAVTNGTVSIAMRNPLDKELNINREGTRLESLNKQLAQKLMELNRGQPEQPAQVPSTPVMTSSVSPGGASQPEPRVELPSDGPKWRVRVLRNGHDSEDLSFPMSEVQGGKK
jgi:pilus assembly protein CpaB